MIAGTPIQALRAALGGDLASGQVCVVLAAPGVGKTGLLVHAALDALLKEQKVLHVAVHDTVDHVRAHYDQIYAGISRRGAVQDWSTSMVRAERNRMIHSYLDREFDTEHLRENLKILSEVAQFTPELVVVDGLDEDTARRCIDALVRLASDLDTPLWISLRMQSDIIPEEVRAAGTVGIRLSSGDGRVDLDLLKGGEVTRLPAALDPATLLVLPEGGQAGARLDADQVTLYSGGALGAEAAFGALAERWGLHEVNFTFPGHKQARETAAYELSPREMAAGDVSLVYVSRRLSRTYSTEGTLIRKVLQTLWHMVSRSQKVIVVGAIQDDGTVVGGTGWSVELARMWNKDLWVYDQEKRGWYRWDGHAWVPGTPRLDAQHVTGTGTRYLTEDGQQALDDLFAVSFG